MDYKVFISHASQDKSFAEKVRRSLQDFGVTAWIDHRELTAGGELAAEIRKAIEEAQVFLTVWTGHALNSDWVGDETLWALGVQEKQKGYTLIPLLLGDEIKPAAIKKIYREEMLCIQARDEAGGLQEVLPQVLAALGIALLPGYQPPAELPPPLPVEELVLILYQAEMVKEDGKDRVRAMAELEYRPANRGPVVNGRPFTLTTPLGPIEADELSWYLERFPRWPGKAFQPRAKQVEEQLPAWGKALFAAALGTAEAVQVRQHWERGGKGHPHRFTVQVKDAPATAPPQMAAAAHLLSLPWEILHNDKRFLFDGTPPVRVRRRLPNHDYKEPLFTKPPLRVLLLSPRPEDETAGYIDHRVTALPVAEALAGLGELAELTILAQPSFAGLTTALWEAQEQGKPFHVVHFDGHGVYLKEQGLGALCFEQKGQQAKLVDRASHIVNGEELAQRLSGYRIPLFFLEACQSAQVELDAASSVAAKLLSREVAAVAAMSHSVLVATAKAFVTVFYQKLAAGERVGEAMLAGQRHLFDHKKRGYYLGAGELELHDWFVPVLYQEGEDLPLVSRVLGESAKELAHKQHQAQLGQLPVSPPHHFVGRSRELLAIERLLMGEKYGVLLGEGGEGKTALACEAARWLVMIHRVERVAFVSLELHTHFNTVLAELGRQLVGQTFSLGSYPDVEQAILAVERELRERGTLLVLDNLETVLPPRAGGQAGAYDQDELARILGLFQRWQGVGQTRLLFTSRERMPPPFDAGRNHVTIGRLAEWDGVELVKNVLQRAGVTPAQEEETDKEQTLLDLVNAVHGHARTLVLLAPELAQSGVAKTTEHLHRIMANLERKHPGERERSLYAGVVLSLNRLSPATRQVIQPLGVFQGGGKLEVIGHVLEIQEPQQLMALAGELAQTGLCTRRENGYLTFHFALCPFLWGQMTEAEQEQAGQRWLAGEYQFVRFLYEQHFQDSQLAAGLTLLDLANLLAGLEQEARAWPVERAMDWATRLAQLVRTVGNKTAQGQVAAMREGLAARLGEGWSRVRFNAEQAHVEGLAAQGRITEACKAAMGVLQRCLAAGEGAYEGADYDVALAYLIAGRYTQEIGNAAKALPLLQESRSRFLPLAEGGNQGARQMDAAALNDQGDCLQTLGKLEKAAQCYQQAGQESEQSGYTRGVAVSQGQLGSVRLDQRRYPEALAAQEQARQTFAKLQEPATVAGCWHQTGIVFQEMEAWGLAEEVYGKSLEIKTNLNNQVGEADTLIQLGNLFHARNRWEGWEAAVVHYRNAASICVRTGDLAKEGVVRNNLADTLQKLDRPADARQEILRAMECNFGHAAEPWKTWNILANIETAAGQAQAGAAARQQARQLFAQYRRDGGENHTVGAQWCQATAVAIQQGQESQAREDFEQAAQHPQQTPEGKALAQVLLAILAGQREGALADREGLDYQNAVEVERLLAQLNGVTP